MATPQTAAHTQVVHVLVSSEPMVVRQPSPVQDANHPSMITRNPAPDASAPMVQTENRAFLLHY